jgi:alpha-beta hydrolase superfamily lysophospholipase
MKLSDILASGVAIPVSPGEFQADAIFLKRLAHFDFIVRDSLKNLRILFCKDLEEGLYGRLKLGESVTSSLLTRPNLRIMTVGDREKSNDPYEFAQEIYIPECTRVTRRLCTFVVFGDNDLLICKAQAVVMSDCDRERLQYIGQHMEERNDRLRTVVSKMQENSVLQMYKMEELLDLFKKTQGLPKPPFKFLLGAKDTLLAYRIFSPINRESIVANVIMVATDTTFLEYLAAAISSSHPIRIILFDLRGFGYSGGKRGHTPSIDQVYRDLSQMVRHVKGFSSKPVLMCGFFFGGGIVINYDHFKDKEPVDGYIVISPIFGRSWAWREGVNALREDKVIKRYPGRLMIASLTGGRINGGKVAIKMKVDENTYDFSPMHVPVITANYVLSYQIDLSGKPFGRLSAPLAVFMAEDEEYLVTKKAQAVIEPALCGESRFIVAHGKTGLGMLLSAADDIAAWIVKLEVVKPWTVRVKEPIHPVVSKADLKSVKSIIPPTVYDSIEREVENHLYDRKPRRTDCDKGSICYDTWEPSYLPGRPIAVLLFLAPRCQAQILPLLAEHHRIFVVRLDPWEPVAGKYDASMKAVWRHVRNAIRVIKANHAAAPFYLGGAGYGANIVIGYAKQKDHCPINGYVLLGPVADRTSAANKEYIIRSQSTGGSEASSAIYGSNPIGDPDAAQKEILERIGYVPHRLGNGSQLSPSKDIVGDIQSLDAPCIALLPKVHPYMRYDKLAPELGKFLKSPFKGVNLLDGDLCQAFGNSLVIIAEWIEQLSSSVAATVDLQLSKPVLDDFEPIEQVGKGTFGRVWLVRHSASNRFLALKVLEKEVVTANKQTKQVLQERRVMEECNGCPFIVSYVGSFQDRRRLYLVMEYLIGGELFTRLNILKRLPVGEARFYLSEVLIAIDYLHSCNIVYRDLKPENIVLDALGHVRLVDFGFARHLDTRGRCSSFCGSPFYIAPEMLSNSQYGKSVDIWAIGVLLYEMVTGGPPFSGTTANEVYRRILFSNLEVPPNIDSDTRDLLYGLLDPSPDTRLGNKNGVADVMKHRWFKGVNWDRVKAKQVSPPHQPHFTFEGDTTNFIKVGGGGPLDLDDEDGESAKYDNSVFAEFS